MKISGFIKSVLIADKGSISSKRVCGVLASLCICIGFIVEVFKTGKMSEQTDMMCLFAMCLLGVDSVTEIWKNKNVNQKDDGKETDA